MPSIVDENIHPQASGEAKKTVDAHSGKQELVFYTGWFCPFAQRAWLTLEEKGLSYEYREHGKPLYESLFLNEFLEDEFPDSKPLLPKDSFERARIRLWIEHLTTKFTPAYFRTMQAQEADKQTETLGELVAALKRYIDQVKGPWFSGEEFSLVDITVAPWINRIYILGEHRGFTDKLVGERWPEYKRLIKE